MIEESKNNNLLKNIQKLIFANYRQILISLVILLILFIGFQTYNYYKIQDIKKSSISFFNTIHNNQDDLSNLENLINDDNIFSVLSKLKLIQQNIQNNNYGYVNELYKEIVFSSDLNQLYKSAIAANASYTFIDASYYKKSDIYLNDISNYIDNINDEIESYFSIKKELEYLLIITEINLNNSEYKNNSIALDKYNEIFNSSSVSASVKERVNKIHEFQLYK